MKLFVISFLVLLTTSGCKKSAVDAVKDWADQSCKCKTEECAKKQQDEFNRLEQKYKSDFDNESTAEAADKHLERANKCLEAFGVNAG